MTGDRSLQIHLFGAEGVSPMGRSALDHPTPHHIAYAVADLAEAERELKARGIDYWIYDSLVSDTSKQVFFEDPFGKIIRAAAAGGDARRAVAITAALQNALSRFHTF